MHFGIDPGSRNLGVAVTDYDGKLIYSTVLDMKVLGGITPTINKLANIAVVYKTNTIAIERYVAYKGLHSAAAEDIVMLIGAMIFAFEMADHKVTLYRAIEWKPSLCKYLYKTVKFNNPSTSFDKKYSYAAAQCITGQKLPSDHEADAVCLSRMWTINDNKNKRS